MLIALRTKRLEKPIITDFLGVMYLRFHSNLLIKTFGSFYQKNTLKIAQKVSKYAIVTNVLDMKLVQMKYDLPCALIPYGIDEVYFEAPKNPLLFRERYKISEDNIITYIGRIHYTKGVEILIKALSYLKKKVKFNAVLAGPFEKHYLRRLINLSITLGLTGRIKFLGSVTGLNKISLLDASKIVVIPSIHYENYCFVIDEAYAREVPIIASTVPIINHRVSHLKTGILVKPNNPYGLANAIYNLLSDSVLYNKICRNIRSIRQKNLRSWTEYASNILKIYEKILGMA